LIRRHFFLAAALAVVILMIVVGALRLLAPAKTEGGPGAGGPGGGAAGRATTVTAITVGSQAFADHIEVLGVAKGRESVTITSNTAELVTAVRFRDGEHVKAGQVLVELKATEEDAGVAQAQAALVKAQNDWQRWDTLAQKGIAPRATADQYKSTLDQATASLAAARSRKLDRVIRAPFAGVVGLSDVAPGALISPGAAIVSLDDLSMIRVDFDVPERYLPVLKPGLVITAHPDAYPGQTFTGRISIIDSRVDQTTRAVKARAEFPNPDGSLKPGMMLRVAIDQGQRTSQAVPEAAVQFEGDQPYVFVITDRGGGKLIAEQRPVTIGARENGVIEIRDGLKPGERIVADGVNRIQANRPIRLVGAGKGGGQSAGQGGGGHPGGGKGPPGGGQ
jgi:membrane fusion protein (multidrug efflux system)